MANIERSETDNAGTPDEDFMSRANERFTAAKEYWDKIYEGCKNDLEFYDADDNAQWATNALNTRSPPGQDERPTLTINRLPQFLNQIVNDYRQATIGMSAIAQGDEDLNAARTYQGLFRWIEKQSNAQVAYITCLTLSACCGIGYLRLLAEYESDKSFDQTLRIARVTSSFKMYPDPHATGFFLEDGEYFFIIEKMKESDYKTEYKEFYEDRSPFDADHGSDWLQDDEIVIAEYFYFEYTADTLCLLSDGTSVLKSVLSKDTPVVKERAVQVKELYWCKIDGKNVLEKRVWPGSRIPIVPVWGNELWVDEKRKVKGFVRNAKDSQRQYNYMESAKTEMIGLSPRAPYLAAEGQLEGHEEEWRNASTTPKAALTYKAITVDGHLVGPPQRNSYEAPVQAIVQASGQAVESMKATIGIYDASLGAHGNETSGIAIERRQRQGATATYNYVDNLSLGIGYLASMAAELIPVIYDTQRQLRIIGEDKKMTTVTVNKPDDEASPNIVDYVYDLVLDTGPSLSTQREETVRSITELSHNFPRLMEVAGDIAVGAMNFTGATEIAARLKRTIPPEVVGPDEDPITKLHAAEQQLQQGKTAIEALTAKVHDLQIEAQEDKIKLLNKHDEIELKKDELDLKRAELAARTADTLAQHESGEKSTEETTGAMAQILEELMRVGREVEATHDTIMNLLKEEDTGNETPPEPSDDQGDLTPPAPPAAETPASEQGMSSQ